MSLVSALPLVGCSGEPTERAASATGKVANGALDADDRFAGVVLVNSTNSGCTGELVSPNRVLTAEHCTLYVGEPVRVNTVTHPGGTRTLGSNVFGKVTRRFGYSKSGDRADDMALIALNGLITNVPYFTLPSPANPCNIDSDTVLALVGFGQTGAQPPSCGLVNPQDRSYVEINDWSFSSSAGGGRWENTFNLTGYQGGLSGDSGGALLLGSLLCGVHSGHEGLGTCDGFLGAVDETTIEAATERRVAQVGQGLEGGRPAEPDEAVSYVDPRTGETTLIGICPGSYLNVAPASIQSFAQADGDGDGVPDLCDTCPSVANPEQMQFVENDTDGDGIPDRCDNCSTVATLAPVGVPQLFAPLFPDADNDGDGVGDSCDWCTSSDPRDRVHAQVAADCNLEGELQRYYPGASAPPVIHLGATYAADLARYHDAFKIGTCEPAPCPTFALSDQGALPTSETPSACKVPPPPGYKAGCAWSVANEIVDAPEPAPSTDPGIGAVHLKWCNCGAPAPLEPSVATIQGRAACSKMSGCIGTRATFTQPQWHDVRTVTAPSMGSIAANWTLANDVTEQILRFTSPPLRNRLFWDYRALGSPYILDRQTNQPFVDGVGLPEDAYANGILWNEVRYGFGYAAGSSAETIVQDRGNSYTSGYAHIKPVWGGHFVLGYIPSLELPVPCQACPQHFTNILIDPDVVSASGTLVYGVTALGAREFPGALSDATRGRLLAAVGKGDRFVAAAEPIGSLDQIMGAGSIRGMVLDATTGIPTAVLYAPEAGATVESSSFGRGVVPEGGPMGEFAAASAGTSAMPLAAATPGPIRDGEGLIASAVRGQLFRFGGIENGRPNDRAWIYSLATRAWRPFDLAPSARPGRVLAATYRFQDDAVYELDLSAGGFLGRLRRWQSRPGDFVTVATFPTLWNAFDRYWLVPGEGGDLFVVASRPYGSVLARFAVVDGQAKFDALTFVPEQIVGRPYASTVGLSLTVRAMPFDPSRPYGGVKQIDVPFGGVRERPFGWCPAE